MKKSLCVLLMTAGWCCAGPLPQCTLAGDGIATTADQAIRSAAAWRCPLVAFVNQPARSVGGAVSYRVDLPGRPAGCWAGGATGGEFLPAAAPDAELLATARRYLAARAWHLGGCPGGVCR
jgi:hypothetical protein